MVTTSCQRTPQARLSRVLKALGVARSVWYARRHSEPKRPGRKRKPVPEALAEKVRAVAGKSPWWGYKRIAVVARRGGVVVSNKQVYKVMKAAGLLQKRRVRNAELYQAARLFELLPSAPNELWQADVTYLHIPGHGWWYAVTVIDYYSRYLLTCHFTPSYRAAHVTAALDAARLHGPLVKSPFLVTDNGPSFLALVPGNHDCCWNTAFSGMTPVAREEEPADLIDVLESPNSPFRWSWQERKLYKILNPDAYARRLDHYWDFVEGFYSDSALTFPIGRDSGYNLFELEGGRILVAGFESLHGNDCFSYHGAFGPKAIANAALRIRDERGYYNLRIAVWHHGVYSQPSYRSDHIHINSVTAVPTKL